MWPPLQAMERGQAWGLAGWCTPGPPGLLIPAPRDQETQGQALRMRRTPPDTAFWPPPVSTGIPLDTESPQRGLALGSPGPGGLRGDLHCWLMPTRHHAQTGRRRP